MKRFFQISFILIALIFGCSKNEEIEIIPDYDKIYLPQKDVDVPAKIVNRNKEIFDRLLEILSTKFKTEKDAFYLFSTKLFIDEEGVLKKVMYKKADHTIVDKRILLNPGVDRLFELVTHELKILVFDPAVRNGKKTKSQLLLEFQLKVDSTGNSSIFSGSLDNVLEKSITETEKEEYSLTAEEMPMPIGGMREIAKNVHYPEIAKRAGIEGRVFVKAFIDENGNVVETEIIKGIGGGCDQAALDAIEATKFKPGRKNGKPVKVQVSIPIMFKLD